MTTEKPFEFRGRKGKAASDVELVETPVPASDVEPVETPQPASKGVEPVETPQPASKGAGFGTWLFLAAAVVAVVIAFTSWRSADGDPDRARGAARDLAMIQGIKAVETMNTMDHRDVEAGVKAWQGVSTGVLHDQLIAIDADQKKLLADQGKIATGRVVQAALTDLKGSTARMIVAVEVTVRDSETDAEPAVKRNRYAADLVLVKGTWKLEDLQQVAVKL
ncbi:hypothetical protein EFK50_11695 [Nocardioides marmoriginsengisoli]|uniref:Mce-associated membrane protein n=1 Tax=Nocardioides marmoriginsengisoli TaxID=661483 RepID=A0A3N0CG54_9ACTN|nr:hypothetical protein [Nocardioides marmoriginsengisoli]RNL62428.1 hypothetical protein EFK50_11695 [Nocardioides marmoriginsengisoli]